MHHVQTAADLREEWFDGAETVGITAGTSTPDASIDEVERWLGLLACRQTHVREPYGTLESHHKQAA